MRANAADLQQWKSELNYRYWMPCAQAFRSSKFGCIQRCGYPDLGVRHGGKALWSQSIDHSEVE